MRTNTFVEQEEVLAVVLEDVSSLTYSCVEVKEVLDCGEWGCS